MRRDWIVYPVVFVAFEIAETQAGFGFVAGDIENLRAVPTKRTANGAFDLRDEVVFIARRAVAAGDVPRGKLLVVVERAELRCIVKILSVRGSHNAHGVGALVSFQCRRRLRFSDLHAGAAVHVVHPDFAGTDAELLFRNENVFAVAGPAPRSETVVPILRYSLQASPVGMHDPDVFAAFAVGNKGDPLAVGR